METALQRPGQPVKRGTMAHDHDVYMLLVDAAARLQDAAAIREYAPRLEELARRDDHKPYLAIAHRAWGVAHRLSNELEAAEARLLQALALFSELGTLWQIGRTHLELAELALARSDPSQARSCYQKAIAGFEQLKSGPDLEHARQGLSALQ